MKKWRVILITGIMILACAGCGTQEAAEAEVREEATVEDRCECGKRTGRGGTGS